MTVRVYLPLTPEELGHVHATGVVPAGIERITPEDDAEESEYAALMTAADASAARQDGDVRRVVLAAEPSASDGEIPLSEVRAVHVDTEPDADADDDLAWYGVQEIGDLVAGNGTNE